MSNNIFLLENISQLEGSKINRKDCILIDLDNFLSDTNGPLAVRLREDMDKSLVEKGYIDLIASLGRNFGPLRWWPSVLSEKNSFNSKLFGRLYKLICLSQTIEKNRGHDVIIICSDLALIKQIRFNYKNRFSVYYSISRRIHRCLLDFYYLLAGILDQSSKALYEYKNLLFVRKALKDKIGYLKGSDNWVVLRTWMDRRSYRSGKYVDPYFKSLPSFISASNKNVLMFAGIISDYRKSVALFKEDDKNTIIPTNFYLKIYDIFLCLFSTYFKRPFLKRGVTFFDSNISFLISAELSEDILSTRFFDSLIQYYSCKRLAESVSIERFIYTFENYNWEKLSILGLKKSGRAMKIIGFQHAFISRNNFKYFPGKDEKEILPLPDKIVTLGKNTMEIMRSLGGYPDNIFSVGCALRQEYLFSLNELPRNVNDGIFVAFTITTEDTVKVLNFLLSSGLGQRKEKVYLRFHPITSKETVFKSMGRKMPDNFIVSENISMEEEMKRCSVVLYTWTTVCLEALKMGRPVIYLDVNYPYEVDPLFECAHLRGVCRKPGDLIGKIDRMRSLDDRTYNEELVKAGRYLKDYFMPVEKKRLSVFME